MPLLSPPPMRTRTARSRPMSSAVMWPPGNDRDPRLRRPQRNPLPRCLRSMADPCSNNSPTATRCAMRRGGGSFSSACMWGGITDVREGMNGFALADLNRDGRPDVIATFSPPSSYHGTKLVPPSRPTSSSKSTSRQDEQPQSERKQNDEPTQRTIQPPRVPSCDRPVAGLGLVTSATTSHTTWAKAWSTE